MTGERKEVDVSVVIPVYGSENSIVPLVTRIDETLMGLGKVFEIICVNDDSPDGVWNVLTALASKMDGRLIAIRLMRNFGQHNATMCGFNHAKGRVIVTVDDDLQHVPEEMPLLLAAMDDDEYDVVYGAYVSKQHSLFRNLGSWAVNRVFRSTFGIGFNFSSYRAIRREVVDSITPYQLNFTFIDGLLAWSTTRIGSVPISHQSRAVGESGYRLSTLLKLALNMATNFSLLPLQIASVTGVLAAFVGIFLGLIYLVQYFVRGFSVPGFASTIIAVLVLGGLQLLALGTIGEYLGRLHLNFNGKPQYLVRDSTDEAGE